MKNKSLSIFISGIPSGVKVGVFDIRKDKDHPNYAILLREATQEDDFIIHEKIDPSLAGVKVRVVIRSAGFLPIEFEAEIDEELGLLHAARLDVDRNYSGSENEVKYVWLSDQEHRKAQVAAQKFQQRL